ncbi:unnamed protein product [Ambrosiozyma monospora]|uniref:Unnamed protein product n=1 Tax=Ambrosiozyma monospora TaxID=43982 RepID=A0ACB5TNT6_AMBMO|nr:unnamed protein product [Ambrosiozyma monospora]
MSNPSNFNYSSQSSQIEPDLNPAAISTTSDPDEPRPTTAFRGNEFHEKEISFKCETCGNRYTKRARLKKHIETKHADNIKRFICEECSKEYSTYDDLQRHLLIHSDRYKCPYCGKRHDRKDRYEKHVERCSKKQTGLLA